uniref:NADH-ubiquinone oxidoreductase chain 3 n=1 Tax=Carcinocoris binghami TaxID=1347739 RepID=A0A342CF92_9HEMI|nr:NADH dehydrogenase subunit 3 [Carcinocoris binghami]AGO28045.1 NADH dehydrogenase subunit 3 [Carcinocoris binghami]
MLITATSSLLSLTIAVILINVCSVISKKSSLDREKMSPFECGFDPKSSSRMPFSIQFFLIAVLFIIFDIEIVIILPMVIMMKTSAMTSWAMTVSMFIIILVSGLLHEWKNGMLEWTF